MPDTDPVDQQPIPPEPEGVDNPLPAGEEASVPKMIPKARFDEVNNKYRELLRWKQEMESKQAKEEEERLRAQAEWKALAEKLETERNEFQRKAQELETAVLERDRQTAFWTEAGKAGIPGDRIPDAYRLVDWVEGLDPATAVKELIQKRPWLIGPSSPSLPHHPEAGKGPGGANRSGLASGIRYLPPGVIPPRQ